MNEFVRISDSERIYGAKTLLQTQVSSINLIKHFGEYEKLRKEELMLRIGLKTKVEQALQSINSLARGLPKTVFAEENIVEQNLFTPFIKEEHKKRTVDDELDEIRRKLLALR
jgi:hypothetical protein